MHTLATVLGLASGLALVGRSLDAPTMIATSLAVDATLGPLTLVIARRAGRSSLLWTVLGFSLGMWALLAILIVRSRRQRIAPQVPPTRDAA